MEDVFDWKSEDEDLFRRRIDYKTVERIVSGLRVFVFHFSLEVIHHATRIIVSFATQARSSRRVATWHNTDLDVFDTSLTRLYCCSDSRVG